MRFLLKSLMGLWQIPFFLIGWLAWLAWDVTKLGAWSCERWIDRDLEEIRTKRERT